MRSEDELEIRITFLEDQLNKMNIVLAAQDRRIEDLAAGTKELASKVKTLEEDAAGGGVGMPSGGSETGGPSERPPDGRNR